MVTDTCLSSHPLKPLIDQAASQCVKCGLCLPHCPTYVVGKNENESARGRIALMQGAVREQVPITQLLHYHVDTCLNCGACERVCPAGVRYETLITSTRAWLNPAQKPSRLEQLIISILEHTRYRRWFATCTKIYNRLRLARIFSFKKYEKIHALIAYLSQVDLYETAKKSVAKAPTKENALLLAPCASTLFDKKTIHDAQAVLEKMDYAVSITQECCGALSLHAGKLESAQLLAQKQSAYWNASHPSMIITLATGCHATLMNYPQPPMNIEVPAIPLLTIEECVLDALKKKKAAIQPLKKRVLVHVPCTLRNTIQKPQLSIDLLKFIPEINIQVVPSNMGCCGAAGSYFLRHAKISQQLVNPIVDFIRTQKPDIWVTSNVGCALHIQQALKAEGIDIVLMHPISLVAQQIA